MRVALLHELEAKDNDVYLFECVLDNVVINNNYIGVKVMDTNFNKVRCIDLFEGVIIHSLYKHYYNNEVLLYCPDNECMIYTNLDSGDFQIIELKNEFADIVFSSIYIWKEQDVLFTDYQGRFYKLCIERKRLEAVDLNTIMKSHMPFYDLWSKISKYKMISLHENGTGDYMLFEDKDHNRIGVLNYQTNQESYITYPSYRAHEIIFRNGLFAFVQEDSICLLKNGRKIDKIKPQSLFSFLRGRFVYDNGKSKLFTLSSNRSDATNSILSSYDVSSWM
ncbi:hypothetical protein SAMN04487866_101521 [Thermoactinomyces sp. DSM 45891]|uniref:hypothetical protein n=1 Tax=Thermoactinomyces sp. DSM 45891 TaxID=1761907 RepID=UPI0009232E12|nr:hypothetical protein [Thermoactinomyces sp. DSM 45891]SFX09919.1 hypothetical protein SAMN04487866_101521 [Thermoactinomyces sp. DSM 45891]